MKDNMSTAQIEKAFEAWPQVEPALRVPRNDREYCRLVKRLDRLVEKRAKTKTIRSPR